MIIGTTIKPGSDNPSYWTESGGDSGLLCVESDVFISTLEPISVSVETKNRNQTDSDADITFLTPTAEIDGTGLKTFEFTGCLELVRVNYDTVPGSPSSAFAHITEYGIAWRENQVPNEAVLFPEAASRDSWLTGVEALEGFSMEAPKLSYIGDDGYTGSYLGGSWMPPMHGKAACCGECEGGSCGDGGTSDDSGFIAGAITTGVPLVWSSSPAASPFGITIGTWDLGKFECFSECEGRSAGRCKWTIPLKTEDKTILMIQHNRWKKEEGPCVDDTLNCKETCNTEFVEYLVFDGAELAESGGGFSEQIADSISEDGCWIKVDIDNYVLSSSNTDYTTVLKLLEQHGKKSLTVCGKKVLKGEYQGLIQDTKGIRIVKKIVDMAKKSGKSLGARFYHLTRECCVGKKKYVGGNWWMVGVARSGENGSGQGDITVTNTNGGGTNGGGAARHKSELTCTPIGQVGKLMGHTNPKDCTKP